MIKAVHWQISTLFKNVALVLHLTIMIITIVQLMHLQMRDSPHPLYPHPLMYWQWTTFPEAVAETHVASDGDLSLSTHSVSQGTWSLATYGYLLAVEESAVASDTRTETTHALQYWNETTTFSTSCKRALQIVVWHLSRHLQFGSNMWGWCPCIVWGGHKHHK